MASHTRSPPRLPVNFMVFHPSSSHFHALPPLFHLESHQHKGTSTQHATLSARGRAKVRGGGCNRYASLRRISPVIQRRADHSALFCPLLREPSLSPLCPSFILQLDPKAPPRITLIDTSTLCVSER